MAYVSLYRKYRPQTFAEVVGQDHVTRTVMNAIESDRLHHAYLFTGPRGTGKTSTARILAKSINCESGPTATPCNTCRHCVEITAGSSLDVIELDMASHGGVDDARELRDRALFAPASARKKVYILDEVHMASTAAFNALLKLIEEPPSHVVFTMATTDPQKVLPTIMSRVQRLDLRRVGAADVAAHLRDLCGREGRTIDERALDAVVRAGDGSVRDSLSVLEQVLSYVSDIHVTGAEVDAVLGTTDVTDTAAVVDAISVGDLAEALGIVQSLLGAGRDLRRFAFDVLQHLRDLLVLQVAPTRPDLVDATEERRAILQRQAQTVPAALLVQAVDLLAGAVTEMRLGPPRLPLELVLAKLTVGRGIDMAAAASLTGLPTADADPSQLARAAAAAAAAITTSEPEPEPVGAVDPEPTPTPESEPVAAVDPEPTEASVQPSHATPERDGSSGGSSEEPPPATPEGDGDGWDDGPDRTPQPSLAARARALAETSPPVDDSPKRPDGPEAVVETPPPSPSDEDLARIQQRWDAVLEVLKDHGMRVKAIFEPAHPIRLRNNVLTLRYSVRYGSFHAENAARGEFADALTAAIEKTCGIRVKVDTLVEGNDAPPGASPVSAAPTTPDEARKAHVREAEATDVELDPVADQRRAVGLLVDELGATPVD